MFTCPMHYPRLGTGGSLLNWFFCDFPRLLRNGISLLAIRNQVSGGQRIQNCSKTIYLSPKRRKPDPLLLGPRGGPIFVNSSPQAARDEVGSLSQFVLTEAADYYTGLDGTYWLVSVVCSLPKASGLPRVQFYKSQISKHRSFIREAEWAEFRL